jgi:uncharacterized protein (DUF885 family)
MKHALLIATALTVAGCATSRTSEVVSAPTADTAAPVAEAAPVPVRNAELADFFVAADKAELALSPMAKSYRAIKDEDYAKLDQLTDAEEEAERALRLQQVEQLKSRFNRASLSPEDQLSYDLFLYRAAQAESLWPFRKQGYLFDQMNGYQSQLPAFLINIHQVSSVSDAEAYVSRLT